MFCGKNHRRRSSDFVQISSRIFDVLYFVKTHQKKCLEFLEKSIKSHRKKEDTLSEKRKGISEKELINLQNYFYYGTLGTEWVAHLYLDPVHA